MVITDKLKLAGKYNQERIIATSEDGDGSRVRYYTTTHARGKSLGDRDPLWGVWRRSADSQQTKRL
jgi:hypothetical protein